MDFKKQYYWQRDFIRIRGQTSENFIKVYTNIKVYIPKHRGPKYIKQKLTDLKGEINNLTIIVGNYNITFLIIKRIGTNQQGYH